MATRDNPLVVMLDSLDQLSPQHQAHKLNWLPRQLPPHVYIIVSTLPEMYNILDVLQGMITDKNNFVEVPSLGENLSISVLLQWLKEAGRTVTGMIIQNTNASKLLFNIFHSPLNIPPN